MRIAFIEVRDKTALFEKVALELSEHDIHWLVQNHAFAQLNMANITLLPYPKRREMRDVSLKAELASYADDLDFVKSADRHSLHFGSTGEHVEWYFREILNWFERVQPNLIIGEPGNFHSHIVARIATKKGIPFLNPMTLPYPRRRFQFYLGDRRIPVGGSSDNWTEEKLAGLANRIRTGGEPIGYMKPAKVSFKAATNYRVKILIEWFRGERYCTQSPLAFILAKRRRKRIVDSWQKTALSTQSIGKNQVLFPLHMQPELVADVWGYEFNNQTKLVKQLSNCLLQLGNSKLLVKPNPKPFWEMNKALEIAVSSSMNVVPVAFGVGINSLLSNVDCVVTISGTVAIECLMKEVPVVILLDDYSEMLGVPTAKSLGVDVPNGILQSDFVDRISQAQERINKIDVLRKLIAESYPGEISEPLIYPKVLEDQNIQAIADAIRHVAPIAMEIYGGAREK